MPGHARHAARQARSLTASSDTEREHDRGSRKVVPLWPFPAGNPFHSPRFARGEPTCPYEEPKRVGGASIRRRQAGIPDIQAPG